MFLFTFAGLEQVSPMITETAGVTFGSQDQTVRWRCA